MPPRKNVQPKTGPIEPGISLPGKNIPIRPIPEQEWTKMVPPELAKELALLRQKYDATITKALKDPETEQRYIQNPVQVLDQLKVPLSTALRKALEGPTGMDKLAVPPRLFLPVKQVVIPETNVHIREKEPVVQPYPHPIANVYLFTPDPWAHIFKPTGFLNHGFPVVYEITKQYIKSLSSQWFDQGPVHDLIQELSKKIPDQVLRALQELLNLAHETFDLDIDLGMPPGKTTTLPDVLTISLSIPHLDPANPPDPNKIQVSAFLSISASVIVDHSDPACEQVYMDLVNNLAGCTATFTFKFPNQNPQVFDLSNDFSMLLKSMKLDKKNPGRIPVFFDVPVDRSGKTDMVPTRYDMRILDDTSSADCDTLALLMSFKGYENGDRNAFTQSFISSGSGLLVDFNWLRAKILPLLKTALKLPTDIDPDSGWWLGEAPIENGDGAVLTTLGLGILPGDPKITVIMTARKGGDCYTAYGAMSVTLDLGADKDGKLIFDVNLGTPTVNIDVPWYCYLLSIVVGGALGGFLLGSIGTLVGMILTPCLLFSIQGIAQTTLSDITDKVNAKIQGQTTQIDKIDLGFLKTVIKNATFDDLLMLQEVTIYDSLPALLSETVFIPDGGYLDLTNGQVAPMQGSVGSLGIAGSGANRVLMTIGNTSISPVGIQDPETVTRYQIYHCSYQTTQRLSLGQFGSWSGSQFQPNRMVWAARTEDGHFARFSVTAAPDDGLWIQYKTYPLEMGEAVVTPVLSLSGGFTAHKVYVLPTPGTQPAFQSLAGLGTTAWGSWGTKTTWYDEGNFTVSGTGFKNPLSIQWKVQGQALAGSSGNVTVNGAQFQYEVKGPALKLTIYPIVIMSILIEASVTDANGRHATTSLTAKTVGGGMFALIDNEAKQKETPGLGEYMRAYKKHIGPWTEIDPMHVVDQGYRVDTQAREQGGGRQRGLSFQIKRKT